jgi:hypothetical protein
MNSTPRAGVALKRRAGEQAQHERILHGKSDDVFHRVSIHQR